MGYSPAALATNSIVTGESPGFARGTAFFTLNALISTPCGPSADRTRSRTVSPSTTSIVAGSNANRRATTSNTLGSGAGAAGCCPKAAIAPAIKQVIEMVDMSVDRTPWPDTKQYIYPRRSPKILEKSEKMDRSALNRLTYQVSTYLFRP